MTRLRHVGATICAALGAVLFLVLLSSLLRVDAVPRFAVLGLAALGILAALRPADALVALAVGVPIASWVGRQWNPAVAWPEALAVAFCAGYCARGIGGSSNQRPQTIDAPVFSTIAIVAASLLVQLLIDGWRFGEGSTFDQLGVLIRSGYFVSADSSDPIDAAMRLIESLIIFRAAASLTWGIDGSGRRLAVWIAIGGSAASALNLVRLWEGATRLDAPLAAFIRYLLTERLNVHYADVNAAGSYYVLALFVALGLALAPKGRRWFAAVLLIALSLWLSGSRMAFVSGLLALLLPAAAAAARLRRTQLRWMVAAAAAVLLAALAGAAAYAIPERGNQQSPLAAFQVRWELARTSARMAASRPAFGVGVGRYYGLSGEYSSPELLELFPPAVHENAHNNFLQLLAELGLVGFSALVWVLASAGVRAARLVRAGPQDPLRWGLVTGLVAFVMTWVGSPPLLIDEPAFSFWLVLGVVAGWGQGFAMPAPGRIGATVAAALVLIVVISVPLRFVQERADFNLEHRGVGLSPWQSAMDGVRYRVAGRSCSLFVPADAQTIVVPLRAMSPHQDLRVRMMLDGRAADVIIVRSDRWQSLRLHLPQERNAPRFRRLELHVDALSPADEDVLMIGKVEPK